MNHNAHIRDNYLRTSSTSILKESRVATEVLVLNATSAQNSTKHTCAAPHASKEHEHILDVLTSTYVTNYPRGIVQGRRSFEHNFLATAINNSTLFRPPDNSLPLSPLFPLFSLSFAFTTVIKTALLPPLLARERDFFEFQFGADEADVEDRGREG